MKKGTIFILLTALVFSTMEIAGKLLTGDLNAFQVTFIRFFIGLLLLFPFAWKDLRTKGLKLRKKDYKIFFIAGIICIPISMTLLQVAVEYTKASTAAVVFSTNPVFTIPFAFLFLKEKVSKRMVYSLVFSFIGILFIFNPFGLMIDIKGIAFALLAAVSFSLFSILSRKYVHHYGGYIYNFFSFASGTFVLFLIMLVTGKPVLANISQTNLPYLIYIGIVVTGLGYIFFLGAIRETSAVKASMIFFIKPALAPILSLIIIKETIPINTLAGIILIVLGSYLALRPQEKDKNVQGKSIEELQ